MQFLPSLGSGILERSNFLEENVVRFWPSHNFGFLFEVHRVSICGSPTSAGGAIVAPPFVGALAQSRREHPKIDPRKTAWLGREFMRHCRSVWETQCEF